MKMPIIIFCNSWWRVHSLFYSLNTLMMLSSQRYEPTRSQILGLNSRGKTKEILGIYFDMFISWAPCQTRLWGSKMSQNTEVWLIINLSLRKRRKLSFLINLSCLGSHHQSKSIQTFVSCFIESKTHRCQSVGVYLMSSDTRNVIFITVME